MSTITQGDLVNGTLMTAGATLRPFRFGASDVLDTRDKKVPILDNHDDFGGHAKRNEHTINDKTRITIGNSDSAPGADDLMAVKMAWRAVNELG